MRAVGDNRKRLKSRQLLSEVVGEGKGPANHPVELSNTISSIDPVINPSPTHPSPPRLGQSIVLFCLMDDRNFKLAEQLVNPTYIRLAQNSINKREKMVRELLTQRQLPAQPYDELTIRYLLDTLALMDSNNFEGKVGVGERQSRIFSRLVEERHFSMGHGIGRSGDVTANQPKAAGSSLLLQLARYLTVSALHELSYDFVSSVLLLPLATGMSLSMAFLTLSEQRPNRKYVLWSRIDQKTCLKAIITANLTPICIELQQSKDHLSTNLASFQQKILQLGAENILAIASTTSCFAPRIPDKVDQLSKLAKKYGLYHVVNNAYGIWCSKIAHSIKQGMRLGQCTVVVQSTDKNFMVPVGGSFIFAQNNDLLDQISGKYPGRASSSPIVDLFITLLSMGKSSIRLLRKERKECFDKMGKMANSIANKYNCRVLESPLNTISMAMWLQFAQLDTNQLTQLGSILYSKRVMGHRIVVPSQKSTSIGGLKFNNYGSHSENYQFLPYITFACAVGTKLQQLQLFFKRLEEAVAELIKKKAKALKTQKSMKSQRTEKTEIKSQISESDYLHSTQKEQQRSIQKPRPLSQSKQESPGQFDIKRQQPSSDFSSTL